MKALSRVRAVVTFLAVLLATVLGSSSAHAGTLQIRDELHVLTRDDAARLRAVLAAAPFDGRFVLTSAYAERQSFDGYVHSLVSEPNMVVVGVDPEHRHALAHFGVGANIPRDQYQAIERSGTDAFRRGEWEAGAAAIFTEAAHAVGHGAAEPAAPEARSHSSVPGVLLVLLLAVGAVGIAAFFARRRSLYTPPGAGYGGGPYGGAGYPGGPYGGGPMVGPTQGGLGPVGGGLIGAGLGGLAGYELGKMEGEREERGRDRGWEGGGGNDRGDDNFDAGGAGSSWDGGGGDSGDGGFDGGSGDGGGGSDF